MSAHTPTPWRVEEGTDLIWGACNPDDQSTYGMGYSIVQGKSGAWGNRKPDMDEREANAALIVKAVNNFEALVKALQLARTRIEYLGAACQNPKHFEANADTFLPAIDEVLAAAGRGQ
jgi:hypothetical protein